MYMQEHWEVEAGLDTACWSRMAGSGAVARSSEVVEEKGPLQCVRVRAVCSPGTCCDLPGCFHLTQGVSEVGERGCLGGVDGSDGTMGVPIGKCSPRLSQVPGKTKLPHRYNLFLQLGAGPPSPPMPPKGHISTKTPPIDKPPPVPIIPSHMECIVSVCSTVRG